MPAATNAASTAPAAAAASAATAPGAEPAFDAHRHAVSLEHPRLFGSLARLKQLAADRPDAYRRMATFTRAIDPAKYDQSEHDRVFSIALTAALEHDAALAAEARRLAMVYVNGKIRVGHDTYGYDCARVAVAYDLCHAAFSAEDRVKLFTYMNKTIDANVDEEVSVFHNGFYGYKNWGFGLISYATLYENPNAAGYLATLEHEIVTRAAPALDFGGAGGVFCEGYYLNYFIYEWHVFLEAARLCEGLDYYALSPKFWKSRAVASMFDTEPGVNADGLRRPLPMGDAGREPAIICDRLLASRRLLAASYPDDPDHRVIARFDARTPHYNRPGAGYKDFLWGPGVEPAAPEALENFRLSHYSPAAGAVFGRSSWQPDATHFFFHCSKRFTSHQHLDVGHFLIYKHDELVGDGGHYDSFDNDNCVNYYMRSIAHNVVLVYDPAEQFQRMRMGPPPVNDGGQHFPWTGTPMRHNGFAWDIEHFQANRALTDIAEVLDVQEAGRYLYVVGDCTRAYAPTKVENFTRQIVFLRPGTFVIFDRVRATDPSFEKTWLLQCLNPPDGGVALNTDLDDCRAFHFSAGPGRLFVQTLLPERTQTRFCAGEQLYEHHGHKVEITRQMPRPPECRAEISTVEPAREHFFLHVLTATDTSVAAVPAASVLRKDTAVIVTVPGVGATVQFDTERIKMQTVFTP